MCKGWDRRQGASASFFQVYGSAGWGRRWLEDSRGMVCLEIVDNPSGISSNASRPTLRQPPSLSKKLPTQACAILETQTPSLSRQSSNTERGMQR